MEESVVEDKRVRIHDLLSTPTSGPGESASIYKLTRQE